MTPIIRIADFSFSIGETQILNHVSLDLLKGEFVSIIGPNGAGKSTLLNCLMRIYKGGTGVLEIDGNDIETFSQRKLARRISFIPQQDLSGFPVTVDEYVLMSRYPHMSPFSTVSDSDHAAVNRALEITGCTRFAHRNIATLSGGERRTVSIAAALAQESRIMLLDEPTTFLDPKHERDIFALIRNINRDLGYTILMVTHDINHAALSSDRICIIKNGECAYFGEPKAMMNNEILEPLFDTSFDFIAHPDNGFPVILPEGGRD